MSKNLAKHNVNTGRWKYGFALALSTTVLWGVLPVSLKMLIAEMDSASVVWFRMLSASLILWTLLTITKSIPKRSDFNSSLVFFLFSCAVCVAVNFYFFMDSLNYISPSNSQLFIQLGPIFMGIGAIVFFKERYSWSQWVSQAFLICGFVLFFWDQLSHTTSKTEDTYAWGVLVVVVSAIAWGTYALLQKKLQSSLKPAQILAILYFLCTILLLPTAKPSSIFNLSFLGWVGLVFASLNTVLAYGAFAESLRHWHASRISAVLALTPVITMITAWISEAWNPYKNYSEAIDPIGLVGASIVVASSMYIALARKAKAVKD